LLEEEDVFLNEHLASWVGAFCENIRRFDTTGFYGGLADVTEGWIYCDQKIIKGLGEL
jgi:TorA maturation chaperone TorD